MFERFTDRARKCMALANQEAQRFNHEYIGTEHILLGLMKEGTGVASTVLINMDVDPRRVRLTIEQNIKSGPDMVTMGKLPQTPRAKLSIGYAIEEARNLGHNYVGSEHLLLGIIRAGGDACDALAPLTLDKVKKEILLLFNTDKKGDTEDEKIIKKNVHRVFEQGVLAALHVKPNQKIVDIQYDFLTGVFEVYTVEIL